MQASEEWSKGRRQWSAPEESGVAVVVMGNTTENQHCQGNLISCRIYMTTYYTTRLLQQLTVRKTPV